jgi:hypothetical protein
LQQLPQEVLQHGWQQVLQQQRLENNRLNKPGFLQQQHGEQQHVCWQQVVQQVVCGQHGWQHVVCGQQGWHAGAGQAGAGHAGAGQASQATGTLRQRLTHTSTGTHVLT